MLSLTLGSALIAIGKPIYSAVGNFLKFVYMLTMLPLAFTQMGVVGAVVVVALKELPYYGTINYGLWREKLTAISQDIQATILLFVLIALAFSIRHLMGVELPIHAIL